jgi:DNA uptake protein ComE-like DNA-binding protein
MTMLLFWNASQRAVLLGLLVILLVYFSIRYWMNPAYVSDPPPLAPARADELADRIDPNIADEATLAALPVIGPKRAGDIVAYREKFQSEHPGRPAFKRPSDLMNIKGIGDATVESLKDYLMFPCTRPSE